MKKVYTTVAMACVAFAMSAQSQRFVLVEEFTQASCGPCAAQNPAFNTLMAANSSKATSIKYQTNWPGVDPMNVQTQTWVGPRVTYYSVSGVPFGTVDGVAINNDCNYYAGAPACLSQSEVDAAYNTPSPFTINLTHTMSSDLDSVFITMVITASQSFTSNGTLKAQLALVERTISFTSAPGSNGELDFYNVMRKMLPNASGTTLPSTWNNGDAQTVTISTGVPAYTYKLGELAVVGFVQSDGDKVVQQAAYSAPVAVPNNAATSALTGVPGITCSSSFIPSVTLTNTGTATLTSCDISYQVDANTPVIYNWTGSLAANATATVTLPAITASAGTHTLTVMPANPNGQPIFVTQFGSVAQSFTVISGAGSSLPYVNAMTSSAFPYSGWSLNNPDGAITWARVTTNTGSLKYDCFSYGSTGAIDEFTVEPVDLSATSVASLNFKVAHRQYSSTYTDAMEVLVSTDCGATWTSVWSKSGSTLATVTPASTSAFTPSAAQWRAECVNLNAYTGNNQVFIMFRGINGYGNNIYVDDIDVNGSSCTIGITEAASNANSFNVYPNPVNTVANVNLSLASSNAVVMTVSDMLGKVVFTNNYGTLRAGEHTLAIDAAKFEAGLYFVTIKAGEETITKKITVAK